MKHKSIYFLLLVGMVALTGMITGCTEFPAPEMTINPISFAIDEMGFENGSAHTRGTKTTSISSFGVSASVCGASSTYTSVGCGSYFCDESATAGTPMNYCWPTSDYKISFFGYYPKGNASFTLQSTANTTGAPTYHYTVPSAIANQVDVMTGQNVNILGGGLATVSLTMKHRCAAICFSVTNSRSSAITLNSISIEGVKYEGTLCEDTWTLTSAVNSSLSNPFTLSYGSSIAASATANVTGTTNIFLMLPQTIPAGAKVKVVINGEDPLYADLTGSWLAGKQYNYSLTVENDAVVIVDENSEVEDWEKYGTGQYLTFIALEDGTFTLTIPANVATSNITSVSYSLDDGETWTTTPNSSSEVVITTPTVTAYNKVLWKATGNKLANSTSSGRYSYFSSTGNYSIEGNIMSMLYGDDFKKEKSLSGKTYAFAYLFYSNSKLEDASNLILPATTLANYCYANMFYNCQSMTVAPELPATTAKDYCYNNMFYNCRSLITAPELPATTLARNCYYGMFSYCTSLTTAPELPATALAGYCYNNMFYGCTSLTTAPELPATTLTDYCYDYMFRGCTSLIAAPELPATTMKTYCYGGMFRGCTSLTAAPELPATTLEESCYNEMFYGCTSLTTAPELSVTTLKRSCYAMMFRGCTSLITAPELPATTLEAFCYSYMFAGCTSLTTAPELPATALAGYCYNYMFYGCNNLDYIKAAFTTTPTDNYTSQWVRGVKNTGTFVKNEDATWDVIGDNGIPNGWSVQTYQP